MGEFYFEILEAVEAEATDCSSRVDASRSADARLQICAKELCRLALTELTRAV